MANVLEKWRKANIMSTFFKKSGQEDLGNHRLVSLDSVPGKMEVTTWSGTEQKIVVV